MDELPPLRWQPYKIYAKCRDTLVIFFPHYSISRETREGIVDNGKGKGSHLARRYRPRRCWYVLNSYKEHDLVSGRRDKGFSSANDGMVRRRLVSQTSTGTRRRTLLTLPC